MYSSNIAGGNVPYYTPYHGPNISADQYIGRALIMYSSNIAGGNVPYYTPYHGPNRLQNLTPKCKILNVFRT